MSKDRNLNKSRLKKWLVGTVFLFVSLSIAHSQSLSMDEFKDSELRSNVVSMQYTYGQYYILPSLVANTRLSYDERRFYNDLWFSFSSSLSDKISYHFAVEVSDLPHDVIGTIFSRSDYPLSTGRFQQSEISYDSKKLYVKVGRGNHFNELKRPEVFAKPVNVDGISWTYISDNWEFKHTIASLRAERSSSINYRRLLNYHHFKYKFGRIDVGISEYFILTGTTIGIDLKRLNPFIPYSRNSHDALEDRYEGFSGDADNAIIKAFSQWESNQWTLILNVYVDELQIDSWDRSFLSDAMLLNMTGIYHPSRGIMGYQSMIEASVSLSNPNFGEHPGPFTTPTNGMYPLFETSTGLKELLFLKIAVNPSIKYLLEFSFHSEKWVLISKIPRDERNIKTALNSLPNISDSLVKLSLTYKFLSRSTVNVEGWYETPNSDLGMRLTALYVF